MGIMKGVLVALQFVGESNLMFDLWLDRYVYDKVCDSKLKIDFAKFMPCICLTHLKLFRPYNSTIEWKRIIQREKSREERFLFPKINGHSNFFID